MNICLFSHYSEEDFIPHYVFTYLKELKRHNDQVWLITNHRSKPVDVGHIKSLGVQLMFVKNEGYDFGMWYKGLSVVGSDCKRLTLANDSCVCFRPLDALYADSGRVDYYGAINSNEINYHIQSFFLVLGPNAVAPITEYFKNSGVIKSDSVQDIIQVYEIGLSQYAMMKNLRLGSFVECNDYKYRDQNVMLLHGQEMLDRLPLVKTKLMNARFRPEERTYLEHWGFDFDFKYQAAVQERYTL